MSVVSTVSTVLSFKDAVRSADMRLIRTMHTQNVEFDAKELMMIAIDTLAEPVVFYLCHEMEIYPDRDHIKQSLEEVQAYVNAFDVDGVWPAGSDPLLVRLYINTVLSYHEFSSDRSKHIDARWWPLSDRLLETRL